MSTVPLPPELIIDILSYLPVKSLCRFKCMSKSWMALIKHPRFIKLHQARSRKQQLFISDKYLYSVDLETSLKPKSYNANNVRPIKLNKWKRQCLDVICGPSNGLFYIKSPLDGFFFIYNPSTRESKKIRDILPVHAKFTLYGFGYVESIDDYKFMRVVSKQCLLIYSLKRDSWKVVEGNFNFEGAVDSGGVSLNGAIHWGVSSYHDDPGEIIVFDLAEEKFKTLPLPVIPNPPQICKCKVRVVGEYLCLAIETYAGFWIMKEYGVQKSWTRIVISHNPFCEYVPLCFWEKNGILLSSDSNKRVFCYEKDEKVRKELTFDRKYYMLPYVESLVSPNYNLNFSTQENLGHFVI